LRGKMKRLLFLLFLIGTIFAQEPKIADFKDNKIGAISITFDDGHYSQYEFAYPIMKKYGFKGTYSIVGNWTQDEPTWFSEDDIFYYEKMSKDNVIELYNDGNEIGWHGLNHEPYNRNGSWFDLDKQMKEEREFIKNYIPEITIHTLTYPYSTTSEIIVRSAKSSGFFFSRTGGDEYNKITSLDYHLLKSFALYHNDGPGEFDFIKMINGAYKKWAILMYHNILPDSMVNYDKLEELNVIDTYIVSPENFESQMKYIYNTNYWVAPIYDVARYMIEKENSKVEIIEKNETKYITVKCNLDKKIFNFPLTVMYKGKTYNIIPNKKVELK